MSTYTEHYKLIKPSYDEDIDVQDINNNMDAIDNTINGLDFVQNAYTNESGLHLNKRDGSIIDIPLDYLKLTGGTVTGDTNFTGVLKNKDKVVEDLFYFKNLKDKITPLIDWDALKEIKGTATTAKTWLKNGVQVTEQVPTWATVTDAVAMWGVPVAKSVIPLKSDFTKYDRIILIASSYNGFDPSTFFSWECAYIDWALNNAPVINIGTGYYNRISLLGYNKWGTQTLPVSTKTQLSFAESSIGSIAEIYGVNYGEVK